MRIAEQSDTTVLAVPESEDEAETLSTLLSAFNGTEALISWVHNRPEENDEHTPIALGVRNDYDPAGGCGGCGSQDTGGVLSWLWSVARETVLYLGLGAALGVLLVIVDEAAQDLLDELRYLLA